MSAIVYDCRLSLFNAVSVLILKDFYGWEPLEFCFIEYSFSVISSARELQFTLLKRHALQVFAQSHFGYPSFICFDIVITLVRPLRAVVSRTTGSDSKTWQTFDRGRFFIAAAIPIGPSWQS